MSEQRKSIGGLAWETDVICALLHLTLLDSLSKTTSRCLEKVVLITAVSHSCNSASIGARTDPCTPAASVLSHNNNVHHWQSEAESNRGAPLAPLRHSQKSSGFVKNVNVLLMSVSSAPLAV